MPGFFDIIFRASKPEPKAPQPKKAKKAKTVKKTKKPDKGEKAKPFVHPLKSKVASLEAELQSLRQPQPEIVTEEPDDDESS